MGEQQGESESRGRGADLQRFWSKVNKDAPGGCWEWTAGCFPVGYGAFRLDGKTWLAHRLSYTWAYGAIPEGLVIDHRVCSNRKCVNPSHLAAVTQGENAGRESRLSHTPCATPGCERHVKSLSSGLCNPCFRKYRRANEERTCSVPGCDGRWHSRDLCSKHYDQARRAGGLPALARRAGDARENARSRTVLDSESGCWLWTGQTKGGYGQVDFVDELGRRKIVAAHRVIWEELRGPIPEGHVLDHVKCGVKLCCNPDHLEAITMAENTARFSRSRPRTGGARRAQYDSGASE